MTMRNCILAVLAGLLLTSSAYGQQYADSDRAAAFRADVEALALDLESARGIERSRARRLAYMATSEAYRYGVPVALVFGVLMQETIDLDARAVSVAGAQGLMQIMPNIWKPVLGRYFGDDLFDEATNIRFGVWILAHYLHRAGGEWREAVRRYSGGARLYAERVQRHVERHGGSMCGEQSFHQCVTIPARRAFGR